MSGIRVNNVWAPVPSATIEVTPTTLIGQFVYAFPAIGPLPPIYIRPGQQGQQDYANIDGAEWLLYGRSVMSYDIEWFDVGAATNGMSMIVAMGSVEFGGVPNLVDCFPFHITACSGMACRGSGIVLSGLLATFRIQTSNNNVGSVPSHVQGTIIVRAM